MLRNREFLTYLGLFLLLGGIGAAAAFAIHPPAGFVTLITVGALCILSFFFTRWRYQEIARLSDYLRQIAGGQYHLDVRDNREGELSILKSEIYKVTVTLREQAEGAKAAKGFLADSLSDISHQLKTPLTSLSVMTELLEDERLPGKKRLEFTRSINSQLQRLKWLVESLLKLSRLDSGLAGFREETINVQELINKATEHLLIPLEIREQTLEVSGDPAASFTGDLNWSREALANVVKNAMEHTPEKGRILIRYGQSPIHTFIAVEDNGPGIAKADLPYIFNRFYKGKDSHHDSAGIGLAMARSIMEEQGGSLEVKSRPGESTVFTLKIHERALRDRTVT